MTLSELLAPDLILAKAVCASKDELISRLLDRIYGAGADIAIPRHDVLHAIQLREQIGGTLLPSGLSVPHARLRDFEGFIIAVGLPASPIPREDTPIRMMAVMISNQSGGLYYLPSLAALTKISRDSEYFSLLCGAETPESFISLIREKDLPLE